MKFTKHYLLKSCQLSVFKLYVLCAFKIKFSLTIITGLIISKQKLYIFLSFKGMILNYLKIIKNVVLYYRIDY